MFCLGIELLSKSVSFIELILLTVMIALMVQDERICVIYMRRLLKHSSDLDVTRLLFKMFCRMQA